MIKKFFFLPAWVYATIYLVLIIVFALIYSFFPQDFYHTTVKYEKATKDHRSKLEFQIAEIFARNISAVCNKGDVMLPEWTLCESKPEVTIGKVDRNILYFTMSTVLLSNTNNNARIVIKAKCTMNAYKGVILNQISKVIKGIKVYERGYLDTQETDIILKKIFDRKLGGENYYALDLSMELNNDIKAYAEAQRGFPSKVDGIFSRMFYLSAVTQTTLGYGDIVPIADRSRWLISAQSVLGIIFIGLFINSSGRKDD